MPEINEIEQETCQKIFENIKYFLNYLNDIYNLCFNIYKKLNDTKIDDITKNYHAICMIFLRITDYLRCIFLLCGRGYPEQAATLAASVFELSQTALLFSYDHEKAENYLQTNNQDRKIKEIIKYDWKKLTEINAETIFSDEKEDFIKQYYSLYSKLCNHKHSHPINYNYIIQDERSYQYKTGPYNDEISLLISWESMLFSGHLAMLVIEVCYIEWFSLEERNIFNSLKETTKTLDKKLSEKIQEHVEQGLIKRTIT